MHILIYQPDSFVAGVVVGILLAVIPIIVITIAMGRSWSSAIIRLRWERDRLLACGQSWLPYRKHKAELLPRASEAEVLGEAGIDELFVRPSP